MRGTYTLQNKIIGSQFELEISQQNFEQLRDAQALFSTIFLIEESLDILMENYFELESGAQSAVIRDMIHRNHSSAYFNSVRAELTRRTINVLATFTTYISVVKKAKFPNADLHDSTKLIVSKFKENDSCRLLEVVRDISQHRDLPVSSLTLGSSWKSTDGSDWNPRLNEAHRSQYTIDFYLNTENIRADRKSKIDPKALSSLDKIGLPMLIRRSLEDVGLAHLEFRERIAPSLKTAQTHVIDAINIYQSHNQSKPYNLHATSSLDHDEDVLIIDDHFEYITNIQEKNSSFVNLSKRVASSYVDD